MNKGDRVKNEAGDTGVVADTFDDRVRVTWDDGYDLDDGKFYNETFLEEA